MHLPDQFDRVVAFVSEKGGVYKTTLIANIGYLFAEPGQRVLVVDLDPQGNLADDLGYADDPGNDRGESLAAALIGQGAPKILSVRKNMDVIPGGPALHRVTPILGMSPQTSVFALRSAIADIVDDYDLVFIDLPPGDRSLRLVALGATRYVMAPTKSDRSSIRGTLSIVLDMNRLRQAGGDNESLELLGLILVGSSEGSTVIRAGAREMIHELFGENDLPELFDSTLRQMESVAIATRKFGKTYKELADDPIAYGRKVNRSANTVLVDTRAIAFEMLSRMTAFEGSDEA